MAAPVLSAAAASLGRGGRGGPPRAERSPCQGGESGANGSAGSQDTRGTVSGSACATRGCRQLWPRQPWRCAQCRAGACLGCEGEPMGPPRDCDARGSISGSACAARGCRQLWPRQPWWGAQCWRRRTPHVRGRADGPAEGGSYWDYGRATAMSLLLRPGRGDEAKPRLLTARGACRAKNADAWTLEALVARVPLAPSGSEMRPHVTGSGVCAVVAVGYQEETTLRVGHEDGSQF